MTQAHIPGRVARTFVSYYIQNSARPRLDFEGAAVFVPEKAAGLDQAPQNSRRNFSYRAPLIFCLSQW